jgi:hypothetical protein
MNEKKYTYEQGQRVYFNLTGTIRGWAKICGAATDELPPLGRSWIIEPEEPVPFSKTTYPFSHITAFGSQLGLKEFDLK